MGANMGKSANLKLPWQIQATIKPSGEKAKDVGISGGSLGGSRTDTLSRVLESLTCIVLP